MKLRLIIMFMAALSHSLGFTECLSAAEVDETFFEIRIRPVFVERCFECHGRDHAKGNFRVDSRDALLKGGDSGSAIVPGNAASSLIMRAIRYSDSDLQMPPKSPLPEKVVADFERWIDAGAPWPAFVPMKTRRVVSVSQVQSRSPDDPGLKPSMQVWLKAEGGPWQDGQAVTLWEDASGRGHDLVATAGARRGGTGAPATFVTRSGIAGFPAVRFDPGSGLGGNAATAPDVIGDADFTLILVTRMKSNPDQRVGIIAGFGEPSTPENPGRARSAGIGIELGTIGGPVLIGGWGNDAVSAVPSSPELLDGPAMILALTKSRGPLASTSSFSINGIEQGSLTGNLETPDFARRDDLGFFMGYAQNWSRGFTGDVAEVLLYNRFLSVEERNGVEAHLSAKYRIPLAAMQREQVVESGDPAFYPNHWAFEPVQKVQPPTNFWLEPPPRSPEWFAEICKSDEVKVNSSDQQPNKVGSDGREPVLNYAIDRFAAAKWVERQLMPVELADTRTLVRRLYFDLIGLPPSPVEMEQAIAELTPWKDAAWLALIDRLLSSPRYGERWGRHWLDVVRYADTAGDNADYPVPEARLYRDYVIDAFNTDKPYDQFLREQLAGDILAAESSREHFAEQIAATGFLALSRRYATAPYELWHLTLEDTIDTVGQAFMGVTLRCARCHDHKFDPITQREYYALYGIFESTQFPWAGGEEFQSQKFPRLHFVPLNPPDEVAPHLAAYAENEKRLNERVLELERDSLLAKSLASQTERLASLKARSANESEIAAAQRDLNKAKKQLDTSKAELRAPLESARRRGFPDAVPIAYAVREGTPRSAFFQRSGDPGQTGPVVARGVPSFLTCVERVNVPEQESGRRQLADWLTRPEHPLTARVFVNRLWQHHFGRGLVSTPSNFGTRGVPPSHPDLLDWLARTLVENRWSIKSMHRLILTSHVWKLASVQDNDNATRDPANVYLWRHDRFRLEAEAIRDSILAASGQLDLAKPDEHPFPPIVNWNYTQHNQFRDFYPSRHRSVYLMTPRLQRHPYLALFDSPDTNTTTGLRMSSIVPAQALYLMNNGEMKVEAEAFAKLILNEPRENRINIAYAFAFQRKADVDEIARATEFLAAYALNADEMAAWTAYCRSLLTSHEFFYVD